MILSTLKVYSPIGVLNRRGILQILRFNSTTPSSSTNFSAKEIETAKKWLENFTHTQIPRRLFNIGYSRSSGPGGQKVNKTSSKATVSLEAGEWLSPQKCYWIPMPIQEQLKTKKIRYETKDSGLLIQSDTFRSRDMNADECFKKLLGEVKSKIYFAGEVSQEDKEKWQKLKVVSKERRLLDKKKHSEKKQNRSKNFDF